MVKENPLILVAAVESHCNSSNEPRAFLLVFDGFLLMNIVVKTIIKKKKNIEMS